MADTTVEIYNQTFYWADFVSNSKTLFSTDANTRYVIKDMELSNNAFSGSFGVVVNDAQVASMTGSLTGTEIVDVSSTVRLTFDTSSGAYVGINCISNTGQAFSSNVAAGAVFYTPSSFVSGAATASTPTAMTQLTSQSSILGGWMLNGNFYYMYNEGNSAQALYRRAGGPTGTQSTIYSDSYSPCCFDGVSKFYWVNSSAQVYSYDTATSSASYIGSFNSGSTYPMICYVAGYVFFSSCYTGQNTLWWYKASTGATGSFGTGTTPYSSNNGSVGFYNAATGAITINVGSMNSWSSSFGTYNISVASGTPTLVSVATGGSSSKAFRYNSLSSLGGTVNIMLGSSNGSYSDIYLVDSSMAVLATKTITNDVFTNSGQSGSIQIITPSDPVKAVTSPTARLRVTGVKTV